MRWKVVSRDGLGAVPAVGYRRAYCSRTQEARAVSEVQMVRSFVGRGVAM